MVSVIKSVPTPPDQLALVAEETLRQQITNPVAAEVSWQDAEGNSLDAVRQIRRDGYLARRQIHLGLLVRARPQKTVIVMVTSAGCAEGAPAFSHLATLIFDRLVDD